MARPVLLFSLALVMTAASQLAAQATSTPVAKGDMVRGVVDGRWVQGTLIDPPNTTTPLHLRSAGHSDPVALPWDATSLQRRIRGGARNRGALIGAAVGFGTGMAMGLISGDDKEDFISFTAPQKGFVFGILFMPIGAIFGAATARGSEWAPLSRTDATSGYSVHLQPEHLRIHIEF